MQDEKQIRAHSLFAYNTVIYPTKYHYIIQKKTIHKIKKPPVKTSGKICPEQDLYFNPHIIQGFTES